MAKRMIILGVVIVIGAAIFFYIRRSIPYSDNAALLTDDISIDSIWSLGPATTIYDSSSGIYYWLKSYTSFDQSGFDTLQNKAARIKYMKFLEGPLENRVYQIKIDSIIVFDQVVASDSTRGTLIGISFC